MLDVLVVTPERLIFEGKAKSVILPGEQGVFEILTYHKPIISRLIAGKLVIGENVFHIRRGIAGLKKEKGNGP